MSPSTIAPTALAARKKPFHSESTWDPSRLAGSHAPAIIAVEKGFFQQELGQHTLKTATFNAGPEATDALFADSIDAAFVGPNPSINAFQKSNGEAIRVVAGSTSGGAGLVVKPSISKASDLAGKKIATPQLG